MSNIFDETAKHLDAADARSMFGKPGFAEPDSAIRPNAAVRPDDASTDLRDQLIRASGSLCFHSACQSGSVADTAPLRVEDAVTLLRADDSPHGGDRLVRGLTHLLLGTNREAQGRAAAVLGYSLEEIFAAAGLVRTATGTLIATTHHDRSEGDARLSVLDRLSMAIRSLLGVPSGCVRSFPVSRPVFNPFSQLAAVSTTIVVERDLDRLAKTFDPISWSRCSSYFRETKVLDTPTPEPVQPSMGETWQGRLFEHLSMMTGGREQASFKVHLDIQATRSERHYHVRYSLLDNIEVFVDGQLAPPGRGLSRDDGEIEISALDEGGQRHLVRFVKEIGFNGWGPLKDFGLNLWAPIGLMLLADEVYDFVCCEPS